MDKGNTKEKIKRTGSMDSVAESFIWKDAAGLITKELGKSVGSVKLYANMDVVPPRAFSTKYHSHSQQEEFFFILSGEGILRLDDEEQTVHAGDFFSKPAGKGIAHSFYNSGEADLLILDIGTNQTEDTCYYPDEDVFLHKMNGIHQAYNGKSLMPDWTSDPNEESPEV